MKEAVFKKDPTFAQLWDICLHNYMYNTPSYVFEIVNLLRSKKITERSKILDTCAGTGFISLYLRKEGFTVDCMDPTEDEIIEFRKNAEKLQVTKNITKISWKEIPQKYPCESYDFLFCRGNSFIYANGGWNEEQSVNKKSSLTAYNKTLKIFHEVLRPGGYLYIDKFFDSETDDEKIISSIHVKGQKEKLIHYRKMYPENSTQKARLIRRTKKGDKGAINETYNLTEEEIEKLLQKAGFITKKISLATEKNFAVWLAQKPLKQSSQ